MSKMDQEFFLSERSKAIDTISMAIIEYKDGDLLAISEIIDMVERIRHCDTAPAAIAFWSGISKHLRASVKTGALVRRDFLSNTLDNLVLISKQLPESQDSIDGDLENLLQSWNALYDDCIEASLVEANAEAVPQNQVIKQQKKRKIDNPFAQEEIFNVFLMEANERLVTAQELCLQLEQNTEEAAICQELFRIFHTFKGECGFFKLTSIGELAHNFENLLDLVRQDQIPVDTKLVDLLLNGVDRCRQMISDLAANKLVYQNEEEFDDLKLAIDSIRATVVQPIGEKLVAAGMISESEKQAILQRQKIQGFTKTFGEVAIEKKMVTREDIEQAVSKKNDKNEQYIKVKAAQINYLVDMVGELIIAQGQVDTNAPNMLPLRKITKEIQMTTLKLRTTKLKSVCFNMHRSIRDVAGKLGKEIDFKYSGDELEIDRHLVEGLNEPLLHIIRNSVYHGIETPAGRIAAGKPTIASVTLDAQRRGNSIVVSIQDDGAGLNRSAILRQAVNQGLVSSASQALMNDKEVWDLIFRPGFSTAEKVDQISGRGVGMDIVRNFVLLHRGRIEIQTEAGKYSRFSLHFPINTAIIDGLIARVADLSIVIPVNQVIESLNYSLIKQFKVGNTVDIVNLRGDVLPVIDINRFFDLDKHTDERRVGVVVEDSYQKKLLFLVDQIIEKREVVVKSLGSTFKKLKCINSGTVLAGGRIGYILDVENVIEAAGTKTKAEEELDGIKPAQDLER